MKRDLTVENVINFFNIKENQINSFNTKKIEIVIKNMLEYFYNDYTEIKLNKNVAFRGGFCEISEGCDFKEYFNIKKIQFNSFYPLITIKLFENDKIIFNIKEYGLLYSFIIKNHKQIRKSSKLSKEGSITCKIFINGLYAISGNSFSNYGINDACEISNYGYNLCNYIFNNFKNDVIYIDTDMIILKEINTELEEYLKVIDLEYDVSDIDFMVLNKKRYLLQEDGIFDIKGISFRRSNNYVDLIEDFRLKILAKSRENKIKNILNKIKNNHYI